ncbi:MAG: hypothetical protein J6W47_08830 [Bacteroidales bacterium]|nr:hypothetical protein [Bacteroidales bacterium]
MINDLQIPNTQWVDWSAMPAFPDQPGTFVLLLKPHCTLPHHRRIEHRPVLHSMQIGGEGYEVLFIRETESLHESIVHCLINGMVHKCDVRKSLGFMLGFRTIGRKNIKGETEAGFTAANEYEITDWLKKNTCLVFWMGVDHEKTLNLIRTYDPPLNYEREIKSKDNAGFLADLHSLRTRPIGEAGESASWYHNGKRHKTDAEQTMFLDQKKSRQDKDFWRSFVFALSVAIVLLLVNLILWSR